MKLLKDRIIKDGTISEGNILRVDSFVNHQIDVNLLNEVSKEFKRRFEGTKITKILTIEVSGIAIASIAAQYF
ncbi:MAG: xanthine phosphoribosyltransferase, partial [Clostridium sp.]